MSDITPLIKLPRIVAFGSSSVYGRGDSERGGFVGRLRSWHEPRRSTNLVYNLGVGGDTTRGMITRFEAEVSYRRPDLILFYPGLNDIRRTGSRSEQTASSPDEYRNNISLILNYSIKMAPTIMISAFPIDETRTAPWQASSQQGIFYLSDDARQFSEYGRLLCQERGVPYLPVFERWSTRAKVETLSIDGLHGGPEAHAQLFEELKSFLCDIFGEN